MTNLEIQTQWLRSNNYADSPEFGLRRSRCPKHKGTGKIYKYERGGYYECWGCVKEEMEKKI